MISEAIVLGAVEAAVYCEDDTWRAVRLAPGDNNVIDCSLYLHLLLNSGVEQRQLSRPPKDLKDLTTQLRYWSRRYQALTMMISGLDAQLSDNTRCTCIQTAEQLLDDNDTLQFVRARLLGCPTSDEADLPGGLQLASQMNASRAIQLYEQLSEVRTRISGVRKNLDTVLFSEFDRTVDPEAARRAIIDAGVVADAVVAFGRQDLKAYLSKQVSLYSLNPALAEEIEHPKALLSRFIDLLTQGDPGVAAIPASPSPGLHRKLRMEATEALMEQEHLLTFGPFRLDRVHGRLWRGAQAIHIRPRSLAVLSYLVERSGRLVTKAELRHHVWRRTHVSDTVFRVCVQEIRAILGDSAAAPQYLETVGRDGYRFYIGGDPAAPPQMAGPIVGRQREVSLLEEGFQRAAQGTRQLVFVHSEVGVGKTALVDLWLGRLEARSGVRLARGQCAEHYGEGEPYLPILEALGQLSREASHSEVLAALRRYAPMWLVQLPGLLPETELERLQRQVQGATPARMLRELADVLDVLAAKEPLLLILEDLHWSDHSTVEALAYLAQRRTPARLLVLGTYRLVETVIRGHPLRQTVQELCGREQAVDLHLGLLPAEDVAAYVAGRLGGPVAPPLAAFVHERTEGNALFMVNIVEHLVQQGLVVRHEGEWTLPAGAEPTLASLPEGLRQFLMRRIEDLQPEVRAVMDAASVAGDAFAVAAVAAGAECRVPDVEARCEALAARHSFIDDIGLVTWPDGTSGGSYRFQHALYQQVVYEQMVTARRVLLHRRIGARLEAGYGARAREIAAQLAVHFERGGEIPRAVHYWQQAGENAARRNAYPEAIAALRTGLALLATLPEGPERTQRELALQLMLGELLMAAQGIASPEA